MYSKPEYIARFLSGEQQIRILTKHYQLRKIQYVKTEDNFFLDKMQKKTLSNCSRVFHHSSSSEYTYLKHLDKLQYEEQEIESIKNQRT